MDLCFIAGHLCFEIDALEFKCVNNSQQQVNQYFMVIVWEKLVGVVFHGQCADNSKSKGYDEWIEGAAISFGKINY